MKAKTPKREQRRHIDTLDGSSCSADKLRLTTLYFMFDGRLGDLLIAPLGLADFLPRLWVFVLRQLQIHFGIYSALYLSCAYHLLFAPFVRFHAHCCGRLACLLLFASLACMHTIVSALNVVSSIRLNSCNCCLRPVLYYVTTVLLLEWVYATRVTAALRTPDQ